MRKALMIAAAVIVGLAIIAGILTIAYTNSEDYKVNTIPEGVTVNGVDCSGLTYDQATEALADRWNSRHLQVVGKLGETLDDYTDFGCTYDLERQLSSISINHPVQAALNHYLHIPYSVNIAMNVDQCGDNLKNDVMSSDFLNKGTIVETQDAYVDLDDPDFGIVPEVYGNKADEQAYLNDILQAIALGQTRFEFDEKAYTSIPEIKSDNPGLLDYQKFCRKYLSQEISYKLGDDSFTLTPEELQDLMKDDGSAEADETKVADFVKKLKKKYDVYGEEMEFTSLTGKTFKVSGGDYGWVIDEEGETARLIKDINSHKDVNRAPVFSQKGHGRYSRTLDLGDTYVDIDITKQHVVFFKDGRKKFETDCVTGCVVAGHSTPTGIYQIRNKLRNITLKGGGKKGSPGYYESFVNYWMAFIGGSIGLHDASWRSSFGGDIYRTSGSHGCVNLPVKKAAELYPILDMGTPVIVHN